MLSSFLYRHINVVRPSVLCVSLVVGIAAAQAADASKSWLSFAKDQPLNASVTLLTLDGKVGRSNPFFNGYRPQLRFAANKHEVTCDIRMEPPREKVEPGETAAVTLRCLEDFKVLEKELFFVVLEGGRKVGEGQLTP